MALTMRPRPASAPGRQGPPRNERDKHTPGVLIESTFTVSEASKIRALLSFTSIYKLDLNLKASLPSCSDVRSG
jgi:hypothetical protein